MTEEARNESEEYHRSDVDNIRPASMSHVSTEVPSLTSLEGLNSCPPEVQHSLSGKWRCQPRCFYIEPVLVLYFFVLFPLDFVGTKYVLDWVRADKIYHDALLNITHPGNVTISPCEPNITDSEYKFQESIQSFSSNFALLESVVIGVPVYAKDCKDLQDSEICLCDAIKQGHGIFATFMAVLLGATSDQYGRRFAVLPPLLGIFFSSIYMTAVVYFQASIYLLFIRDFFYGCCGSSIALLMGCYSFAADNSTPRRRMIRFVILDLSVAVSAAISPVLLGPLIGAVGYAGVSFGAAILSIVNLAYTFWALPSKSAPDTKSIATDPVDDEIRTSADEQLVKDSLASHRVERIASVNSDADEASPLLSSRPNERGAASAGRFQSPLSSSSIGPEPMDDGFSSSNDQPPVSEFSKNDADADSRSTFMSTAAMTVASKRCTTIVFSQMKASLYVFIREPAQTLGNFRTSTGFCHSRRFKLIILLVTFFVTTIPTLDSSVTTLFEMNSPLCWSPTLIGIFTGVTVAITAVGAMIAMPIMRLVLHMDDVTIALVACTAYFVTRVYRAFVRTTLMMFLSSSLSMFSTFMMPSLRAVMSKLVSENEQGSIFGMMACLEVICGVVGTVILNSMYSATVDFMTGFVFLGMSFFSLAGEICLIVYAVLIRIEKRHVADYERLHESSSHDINA